MFRRRFFAEGDGIGRVNGNTATPATAATLSASSAALGNVLGLRQNDPISPNRGVVVDVVEEIGVGAVVEKPRPPSYAVPFPLQQVFLAYPEGVSVGYED